MTRFIETLRELGLREVTIESAVAFLGGVTAYALLVIAGAAS